MKKNPKILVVENHQVFIDGLMHSLCYLGYKNIFSETNCYRAYNRIKSSNHLQGQSFDLLLTDLSFECSGAHRDLDSGESLIKRLKKENIAIKTIIISAHSETNRVFNVIQNLNPEGYILKNDCDTSELGTALRRVLNGNQFYSHEIHQKIMRRNVIQIQMDEVALQILRELPNHPKISNLEGVIKKANGGDLKLRSIESKLSNLRVDLEANNNIDLVLKAKELGMID